MVRCVIFVFLFFFLFFFSLFLFSPFFRGLCWSRRWLYIWKTNLGNFSSLDFEDRALKGTFGRKTVRFSQFEVSYDNVSYIIVKSQQQVEELCERLRLEVFHVSLPQLPPKSPRSPRGGGTGTTPAADEYLIALAEKGASLADSRTLRTVKFRDWVFIFKIFLFFSF
jgi:hypothetical protein